MRILVLTTSDFGGQGGIAKYNRDFINALSSHPPENEITVLPRCIDNPAELQKMPKNVFRYASGATGKTPYVWRIVKLLLSRRRFDLIICAHIHLALVAYVFAKLNRVKTCLILYGVEAWKPSKKKWKNHFTQKMDFAITISNFTKNNFTAWSKKTVQFLLPCAIEMDCFSPGAKDQQLINKYGLSGKSIVTTLGRLDASERYKGFDEVIDVIPKLLEQFPDLVYIIAGDGTDRFRLEEKVKRLNLAASVIFLGYIDESNKVALYRSTDVFVMPGRGEGFGIVYLEARACGIPVIGSTLDASREALMEGELGQLVNPDNPIEIQDAIIIALREKDRTVPEAMITFSIQQFSHRVYSMLDRIFKS